MKNEFIETKVSVIFRKEKDGSILAVFPYNIADWNGEIVESRG